MINRGWRPFFVGYTGRTALVAGLLLPALLVFAGGLSGCSATSWRPPGWWNELSQGNPQAQSATAKPQQSASLSIEGSRGLRADKQARLMVQTLALMELERQGQYGHLYDELGGEALHQTVPRGRFLKITQCVEHHLGEVVGFSRNQLQFSQRQFNNQVVEVVSWPVNRQGAHAKEQALFVEEGLRYRLMGLFWGSKHPGFSACVSRVLAPPPPKASNKTATDKPESDQTAVDTPPSATPEPLEEEAQPPLEPSTLNGPVPL